MAEAIKHYNTEEVKQLAVHMELGELTSRPTEGPPIFITHVHDEAAMRLLSFGLEDSSGLNVPRRLARGRSSKVQNQCISISCKDNDIQWYSELIPMAKKDGPTVALAMSMPIGEIMEALAAGLKHNLVGCKSLRVIHLVVCDGVETNHNAVNRVMAYFEAHAPRANVRYSIVVFRCASHIANLVVMVAICGKATAKPLDVSALCGTCSRMFKYLIPDYMTEFTANLRQHVLDHFVMLETDGADSVHRQRSLALQALYGKEVLPDDIMVLWNRDLSKVEHVRQEGDVAEDIRCEMFVTLHRLILQIQDRPIVTRFWLFTECVFTLARAKLLGLPGSIFTLRTVKPQMINQKRIKNVQSYYNAIASDGEVREAALCLQLTLHITNITAKTRLGDGAEPLLVRLGNGEVQRKACADCERLLPLLDADPQLNQSTALPRLLTTLGHTLIRFEEFNRYPTALWHQPCLNYGSTWSLCRK